MNSVFHAVQDNPILLGLFAAESRFIALNNIPTVTGEL